MENTGTDLLPLLISNEKYMRVISRLKQKFADTKKVNNPASGCQSVFCFAFQALVTFLFL